MATYTEAQMKEIYLPLNINRAVPNNYNNGTRTVQRPNNSIRLYTVLEDAVALLDTTTFLGLTDTPSAYTASQNVTVNSTGTALEFTSVPNTLYTADDSLVDARTVTMGANNLTLASTGGEFEYSYASTSGLITSKLGATSALSYGIYTANTDVSSWLANSNSLTLSRTTASTTNILTLASDGIDLFQTGVTDFRINSDAGTAGQYFGSNGPSLPPTWQTVTTDTRYWMMAEKNNSQSFVDGETGTKLFFNSEVGDIAWASFTDATLVANTGIYKILASVSASSFSDLTNGALGVGINFTGTGTLLNSSVASIRPNSSTSDDTPYSQCVGIMDTSTGEAVVSIEVSSTVGSVTLDSSGSFITIERID